MLQIVDYVLKFAALAALLVAYTGLLVLLYGKASSRQQVSELAGSMISASVFLSFAIVLVKIW